MRVADEPEQAQVAQPSGAPQPVVVEESAPQAPAARPPVGGIETLVAAGHDGGAQTPSEVSPLSHAQALLAQKDFARAARAFSDLLKTEVSSTACDAARVATCVEGLRAAQQNHRWNPKGTWPALAVSVEAGDSLISIRKRVLAKNPQLLLSTGLIERANALRNETAIRPEDTLRIPTDRASAWVDLSSMWAFFLLGDELVDGWQVGVGRDGNETRPGSYVIGLKQENPMWAPVGREPVPFGDPANPLGTRWMAWHENGKPTSLGFHGTNDGQSVGQRVSDGCIRMRNADVEVLFAILPLGAEVRVQP